MQDDVAVDALRANLADYRQLVDAAERAQADGDPESAAVLCQLAASLAWFNHGGIFCDPKLERILHACAPASSSRRRKAAVPRPRHVLHVLTEAYAIGGHTRLARTWIERDDATASVVLTRQSIDPPAALSAAVDRRGGRVYRLAAASSTLVGRAALLRRLADEADAVVLHVHPFDVVPVLAFPAGGAHPPVIVENHADHVFWTGVSIANVVTDFRSSGTEFSGRRRGVPAAHRAVLPIPVDPGEMTISKEEARRQLDLPPDAVVGLSIAQAYKFRPLRGPGLADALLPIAERHPNFRAIIVGPPDDGDWATARAMSGGRVAAVGPQHDLAPFLAAADLYIDSTPVGSGTSILEGVVAGLAPVTLFRFGPSSRQLLSNSPGLGPGHVLVADEEEFADAVGSMIEDPAARVRQAAIARDSVLAMHHGEAWYQALDAVYERAARTTPVGLDWIDGTPEIDDYDEMLVEMHASAGVAKSVAGVAAEHADLLSERTALAVRDARHHVASAIAHASRRSRAVRAALPDHGRLVSDLPPSHRKVLWLATPSGTPVHAAFTTLMSSLRPGDNVHIVDMGANHSDISSLAALGAQLGPVHLHLGCGPNWRGWPPEVLRTDGVTHLAIVGRQAPDSTGGLEALQQALNSDRRIVAAGCSDPDGLSRSSVLVDLDRIRRVAGGGEPLDVVDALRTAGALGLVDGSVTSAVGVPTTFVAPSRWQADLGWLAATLVALEDAIAPDDRVRLVLPLAAEQDQHAAEAAVALVMQVLTDLRIDPESLAADVVIGDDVDLHGTDRSTGRINLSPAEAPTSAHLRSVLDAAGQELKDACHVADR